MRIEPAYIFAKLTSTFLAFSNLQKLIPLSMILGWNLLFQMKKIKKMLQSKKLLSKSG